ncbi:glycoside hydrolase family 97 catalytic domain-containing protein [Serinibacter arcticus]|uniref:glycoside hydrolase family 97 catalytic domain-containing protein n=1 Tax=Serinibacter arcticus TaxID=1655435 RepID=UPI0011B1EC31|nr:glycoside hydrolase family 97 catalytic domain-containing protein [Serinibacter arcticus]
MSVLGASALVAAPASAAPDGEWTVTSPGGGVVADVALEAGVLNLTAGTGGETLVDVADLGLETDTLDLATGLDVVGSSTRTVTETYTMVTGKERERSATHTELRLDLAKGGITFGVVIRAADDGVAFRYDLPAALGTSYEVVQEPTTFTLPPAADAWLQPYGPQYENAHVTTTAANAATRAYGFPSTFRSGEDYVVLTESDVTGTYAGTHLTKVAGAPTYALELYEQVPVEASGALVTPWRVAILGDAATVVESTLVDDLATPSVVADTSWIEPGVSAWSWVPGASRPDLGSQIGAQGNLEFQKSFADLAARNSWPYILIDEGWQAEWVPELVRYAEARGVGVLAWFHSDRLWTREQRDSWFDRLQEWGVRGIKVDFMDSDDQETFRWYDDILAETAERQLMINFHGSTIPHGVQRTWPNAVTFEAVRGEEQGKDSAWASHNTVLPFTRNVVGSMDYTPVRFSGNRPASKAHELALPVVFESGIQHYADTPEAYAAQPAAQRFLRQVPTVWDETRLVAGSPGSEAVIARRDADTWFIGGISGTAARTATVPLEVLGDGEWLVHTITDRNGGLQETVTTRTAADVLSLPLVENGGFALLACPATEGRTACYSGGAQTETLVDVDPTAVAIGDQITVDAVFVVRSGGPVTDVELSLDIPEAWTVVSGETVAAPSVATSGTVTGRWVVRVGPGGPVNDVAISAVAAYTDAEGKAMRNGGSALVQVEPPPLEGDVWVSELPFTEAVTGFGQVGRDLDLNGGKVEVAGVTYDRGLVVHAPGRVSVRLGAQCTVFRAVAGVEPGGERVQEASMTFSVLGDGVTLATAGTDAAPIRVDTPAQTFEVDVTGVETLTLVVGDGGDGRNNDHGAFADARLECAEPAVADGVAVTTAPTAPDGDGGWFVTPPRVFLETTPRGTESLIAYSLDGETWLDYDGAFSVSQEGVTTLSTRLVGVDGSVSETTTTEIRLETSAPSAPVISGIAASGEAGASIGWTAQAVSGIASYAVTLNGEAVAGDVELATADLPAGTHTLTVTATSVAGHTGPTTTATFAIPTEFVDIPVGTLFFDEIAWLSNAGISQGWPLPGGAVEFRPLAPVARDAMAAFLYRQAGSPDYTPPTVSPFVDVPTTNQFYTEIAWAHAQKITTGWERADGGREFRPLAPIARDAMAAFLHRAAGSPVVTAPTVSPFEDVAPGDQFYDEITWMQEQGIATGWAGNDGRFEFRPLDSVKRDAMAAFLFRFDAL